MFTLDQIADTVSSEERRRQFRRNVFIKEDKKVEGAYRL